MKMLVAALADARSSVAMYYNFSNNKYYSITNYQYADNTNESYEREYENETDAKTYLDAYSFKRDLTENYIMF